jgi:serine/threonine protein kinase
MRMMPIGPPRGTGVRPDIEQQFASGVKHRASSISDAHPASVRPMPIAQVGRRAGHGLPGSGYRPTVPPLIAGYERLVEIGRGGFAVVYRAEDTRFRRSVAIKLLHTSFDNGDRSLFERECEAMGVVSRHPNCVTVFDSGVTDDGSPYIVMEDMAGGSLGQRLEHGPMDWYEVLEIGIGLAGALQTAHDAGVLHRDVKPDNVLMSEFGLSKLADFGIARLEDRVFTRTGRAPFTPSQVAPEVLDGDRATAASDVYSLASTLFTLVAGTPPFVRPGDESTFALMARIVRDPPPDLRTRDIPGAVCDALERGLAKAPADRFESAADFGRQLQAAQEAAGQTPTRLLVSKAVGDAPVAEPAPSPPAPGGRRRQLRRIAALIGGLLILGGSVVAVAVLDGETAEPPRSSNVSDPPPTTKTSQSSTTVGNPVATTTPSTARPLARRNRNTTTTTSAEEATPPSSTEPPPTSTTTPPSTLPKPPDPTTTTIPPEPEA